MKRVGGRVRKRNECWCEEVSVAVAEKIRAFEVAFKGRRREI